MIRIVACVLREAAGAIFRVVAFCGVLAFLFLRLTGEVPGLLIGFMVFLLACLLAQIVEDVRLHRRMAERYGAPWN